MAGGGRCDNDRLFSQALGLTGGRSQILQPERGGFVRPRSGAGVGAEVSSRCPGGAVIGLSTPEPRGLGGGGSERVSTPCDVQRPPTPTIAKDSVGVKMPHLISSSGLAVVKLIPVVDTLTGQRSQCSNELGRGEEDG
ncbi:unnamed protein product [Pleuronectes platessa]|uniref:Uncharacterized protein n=1 Tax=Pleuronectes platessa TaxID=8262 RepID=A0A9N7V0C2_PLEPL|nr:unnamed protein product [Pleuronectes platessa]